jgi:rhodanese-related sulfurtransferase
MRATLILLFIFCSTIILHGQEESLQKLLDRYNNHSIPYISVEELKISKNINQIIILDAREKAEFEISHIPSSKYIGYKDFDSNHEMLQKLNRNTEIIVYCSIGIRSEKIAEKLNRLGFKNLKNLYGGIFEWKNKGHRVVDVSGNSTEIVHAYSKKWSKLLHSGKPVY